MLGFPNAEKSGFHIKPNPFATEFSGCAGSGVPNVIILMARMIANIKSKGIAILASFSIPFDIPLYKTQKFIKKVISIKRYAVHIELNVSEVVIP